MNQIKICFIQTYAAPLFNEKLSVTYGGAEFQTYLLANEISKHFRVDYIVGDFDQKDIEFNNNIDKQKLITLGDIDRKSIKDIGFDPQNFLQYDIDTLIPVKGKSQLIALLFTSHSNLFFLDEPEIRGRAENILQKTAQILESTVLHLDLIQRNLEIKKLFEVSNKLLTSLYAGNIYKIRIRL